MSSAADVAWEARCLLRSARSATLATQSDGQPHAALVTPAVLPDASIVMLLSGLSEHTRHLRLEPRCAILITGTATGANPQTAPRLTVIGRATPEHDPAIKERWLRLHPYAAFYAGLPDFVLWRVQPSSGHYVGGFARAARLDATHLQPDAAAQAALASAEPSILDHCNRDHGHALDGIAGAMATAVAGAVSGDAATGWRMVSVDTDGFDLVRGDASRRVHWSTPVGDQMQVRGELVRMAQAARARQGEEPA